MKLISDVINELKEFQETYGNIEVVTADNEDPAFEYQDVDGEEVIVVS